MKKFHKFFKTFEPFCRLIEVTAIVVGVGIALAQLRDLQIQKSAELAIKFNDYLDDDVYAKICETIDAGKPLLKESKPAGRFSKSDVEGYLGIYETIYTLYVRELISRDMFQANFSYDLVKAYENQEIKALIENEQKLDPELWIGFQKLAQLSSKRRSK